MLTTPLFPVLGQPDCEACRRFAARLRTLDEPNGSMELRLPGLHPDLDPTGEGYGIPGSGFGQHLFHDVEAGDGDVDGHCAGHVRDALWPSDLESG